jgi:hypothetical protein
MTAQNDFELWQEYADMMARPRIPTPEDLRRNLAADRKRRREKMLDSGRHFDSSPVRDYEQKIAQIADANCKTPTEWRNAEADDMRHSATGVMVHKSAGELLERYRGKIQSVYRTEQWYEQQIGECEARIAELQKQIVELVQTRRRRTLRGAQNKLRHQRARLAGLQCNLMRHWGKERRLEQKSMKYAGIMEKIKTADVARQIRAERGGVGNKYGFNPHAADRETAEIMFTDD